MWNMLGVALGVTLALGFAGHKGQHWALRVLCLLLMIAGAVVGLVVGIFGGSGSVVFGVTVSAAIAFAVVASLLGLAWLPELLKAVKGREKLAAGSVLGFAVLAGAVGFFRSGGESVQSAVVAEVVPAVAPVGGAACLCGSGNTCTGERGGRYCITAAGKKQYKERE